MTTSARCLPTDGVRASLQLLRCLPHCFVVTGGFQPVSSNREASVPRGHFEGSAQRGQSQGASTAVGVSVEGAVPGGQT